MRLSNWQFHSATYKAPSTRLPLKLGDSIMHTSECCCWVRFVACVHCFQGFLKIPSLLCIPQTSESPSCLSFTPQHTSETVSHRLVSRGLKEWLISEEIMACVSLRVIGPSFSLAFPKIRLITECAIQHHDYASVLSKSISLQFLLTVEGFYVFSLPLDASPFCYLTLQLYHLTLPSILTCSLLKSWKLILLLQTPPRLKICVCALCIITFVDKRDKKFNKTHC